MFGRRTHFYPKSFRRFEEKKLVLEIQKLLEFVDITGYGYERWGGGDGLDGYVQRYNDLK